MTSIASSRPFSRSINCGERAKLAYNTAMQPITVAFFGISGSGKGTQAVLLEDYLKEKDPTRGVIRPEMGSLLRAFMESGTSLAEHTKAIVNSGGLVPSFIPIHMLTSVLNEHFDGSQHVILDGTCRRPDQSRAANDMMRLWGRDNLHVITLTLSPESAKARLIGRGRVGDAKNKAITLPFPLFSN